MNNENTTHKLFSLTRYCSKTKLALFLDISKNTLDKYLNTHEWKKYQVKMIDKWHADIEIIKQTHGNKIISIKIIDEEVSAIIQVSAKRMPQLK